MPSCQQSAHEELRVFDPTPRNTSPVNRPQVKAGETHCGSQPLLPLPTWLRAVSGNDVLRDALGLLTVFLVGGAAFMWAGIAG